MTYFLIFVSVAVSVSGVVYAISSMFASDTNAVEARLENLTKKRSASTSILETGSILTSPLDDAPGLLEAFVGRFFNLRRTLQNAGMGETEPIKFLTIAGVMGGVVALITLVVSPIKSLFLVGFVFGLALPFLYLWFMVRRRLKKFAAQLPDSLDLIGQALRAGQSLPAGIHLVSQQAEDPLGPEFARCYEEQNLGVPLEEALQKLADRIDNLDLRFFVTSVLLQRQTGGDLAEILDKISHLIRERFTIQGQIQALTGEGRLSGVVLLALPPVLFVTMLRLNYDYIMMLFREPLGNQMLAVGIVLQFFGAAMIKKIITIKV
ncbi:MAG: type II secretion system F family protein [Pirellulaceae bacterium]|jgi:tight adherence protein B|nr:type II secretion system F family protein [Pirellulaceae bacterium]